jgi:hypothetical protein
MGIPKFFRYISERYPCIHEKIDRHQVQSYALTNKRSLFIAIITAVVIVVVTDAAAAVAAAAAATPTATNNVALIILITFMIIF